MIITSIRYVKSKYLHLTDIIYTTKTRDLHLTYKSLQNPYA